MSINYSGKSILKTGVNILHRSDRKIGNDSSKFNFLLRIFLLLKRILEIVKISFSEWLKRIKEDIYTPANFEE